MSNPERATGQAAAPDTADDHPAHLPPSRLLLVRHGQSTWNAARRTQGQLDPPLSERGVAEAAALAERLAGRPLAGFYCSDLARCRRTAEVVAGVVGVEPILEPGLREVGLGQWEGKTREELMAEFPELWARWEVEPSWDLVPGGEGARPFWDRVTRTLGTLQALHPHGDVLCVTHGGVIQVALLDVLGRSSRGPFPFLIENCSMTVLQCARDRMVISSVNDTCHLP